VPPWAEDASDFSSKCREALECDYVSSNLHNWIDLIFGYKQRGEEAWKADNVFYYLTYEGAIDLDSIDNENEKKSYEAQIHEFGQTPKQLFTRPHPQRQTSNIPVVSLSSLSMPNNDDIDSPPPIKDIALNDLLSDSTLVVENTLKSSIDVERSPLQWTCKLKKASSSKLHKDAILSISPSLDNLHVFTVSQDTQLKMYSIHDKQQVRGMNLSTMSLSCCVCLPDGNTVLVGSWDNNLYVYSVEFGRVVDTRRIHDDAVTCLCWKNDILLTSSWDSTVKIWNCRLEPSSRKPVISPMGELDHDTEVTSIDMHTDMDKGVTQVVSGTKDGCIIIWDTVMLIPLTQQFSHSDEVSQVLFSPAGERILTCSIDQTMRVFDVCSGSETYCKDVGQPIRCATWDGQVVVLGTQSGEVMVWDLIQVNCLLSVKAHQGAVTSMAVSTTGNSLMTGGEDGTLVTWSKEGS